MIVFPTAWLVPAATAAWAVWTWAHEQSLERERERARITALYVNPFLSACEDLQSRIYKIVELEGLPKLRQRYPDGSYAEETLYLVVRFFGWLAAVGRYGPYTQDPVMIKHTAAIRRAFATSNDERAVGPFNFFPAEQKALGKMVMHSMEGEYGHEMDTISYYEFRDIIQSSYRMPESSAVTQTLETLQTARHAEEIDGWERLAEAQNHLVNLLNYLEKREGFSYFPAKRKKCRSTQQAESERLLRSAV
ncbi:MAG: hypothetical protein GY703_15015 [Gammaproteobacteria bacterium]|nr:hypothetical protein [Gammaproteobacteria bacterium]